MAVPILFFILILVILPVMIALAIKHGRETDAAWTSASQELGGGFARGGFLSKRRFDAAVGGFPVRAETFTRGSGKNSSTYTRIIVDSRGRLPRELGLCGEGGWQAFKKFFTGEDIQIGDHAFDGAVHVKGHPSHVRALLGRQARRQVMQLVGSGAQVRNGQVYYEERGVMRDARRMTALARLMTATAVALDVPQESVPDALADNVLHDTVPGVRRSSLMTLLQTYPHHPQAKHAARTATDDPDPRVRLLCGRALGQEGVDVLEALARRIGPPPALRAEALDLLGRVAPRGRLAETATDLLSSRHPEVRVAALKAAGRARAVHLLDRISQMTQSGSHEVIRAAAEALGRIGDPRSEVTLLNLLDTTDDELRTIVALSLSRMGTIRAVESLLPLTKGLLTDAKLKSAARAAVEAIQSRLGEVEAGRLSLAATEIPLDGALSLSAEGGELALVEVGAPTSRDSNEE